MQIRVVYHGELKDLVGQPVQMFHLEDSSTGASLLSRLTMSHPEAISQLGRFQLSRDGNAITEDTFLSDDDIVVVSAGAAATA